MFAFPRGRAGLQVGTGRCPNWGEMRENACELICNCSKNNGKTLPFCKLIRYLMKLQMPFKCFLFL